MVLGVSKNRLKCMQGQKTLSMSFNNMHLFLFYLFAQRLPNDSLQFHALYVIRAAAVFLTCSQKYVWQYSSVLS